MCVCVCVVCVCVCVCVWELHLQLPQFCVESFKEKGETEDGAQCSLADFGVQSSDVF